MYVGQMNPITFLFQLSTFQEKYRNAIEWPVWIILYLAFRVSCERDFDGLDLRKEIVYVCLFD